MRFNLNSSLKLFGGGAPTTLLLEMAKGLARGYVTRLALGELLKLANSPEPDSHGKLLLKNTSYAVWVRATETAPEQQPQAKMLFTITKDGVRFWVYGWVGKS